MIINVPTSLGELIDKISILKIKNKNITNEQKLLHVQKELSELKSILDNSSIEQDKINPYLEEMMDVNTKLWDIEDQIRECEKNNNFNEKFIDLARSVYKNNDIRSKIKLKINEKFGSHIVEVKSYQDY